jgi:hypothetical protein
VPNDSVFQERLRNERAGVLKPVSMYRRHVRRAGLLRSGGAGDKTDSSLDPIPRLSWQLAPTSVTRHLPGLAYLRRHLTSSLSVLAGCIRLLRLQHGQPTSSFPSARRRAGPSGVYTSVRLYHLGRLYHHACRLSSAAACWPGQRRSLRRTSQVASSWSDRQERHKRGFDAGS